MAAFSMSYFSWMCSLIPIVFSVGWRVSKQSRPQHGESTRVYIFSSPQSYSSSLPISSPHVFSPSHPLTCLHPNTHMASFSRIQHGLLSLELDPDSRLSAGCQLEWKILKSQHCKSRVLVFSCFGLVSFVFLFYFLLLFFLLSSTHLPPLLPSPHHALLTPLYTPTQQHDDLPLLMIIFSMSCLSGNLTLIMKSTQQDASNVLFLPLWTKHVHVHLNVSLVFTFRLCPYP